MTMKQDQNTEGKTLFFDILYLKVPCRDAEPCRHCARLMNAILKLRLPVHEYLSSFLRINILQAMQLIVLFIC